MLHGYLDLPTFTYWSFKNTWTGSMFDTFNYRIFRDEISVEGSEEKKPVLRAVVWYGTDAFEHVVPENYAHDLNEEFSEKGLETIIEFLNARIEEFKSSCGKPIE